MGSQVTRSKHAEHFANVWARQCAQRERWTSNLAPDVPVLQPASGVAPRGGGGVVPIPTAGKQSGPLTPSKFGNEKTDRYASKREAKRAQELRYLEKAGVIRNLSEQVRFLLIPKQDEERPCWYICDFAYEEDARTPLQETPNWRYVCEDVKGVRTRDYIVKRKLMLFVHGIKIRET